MRTFYPTIDTILWMVLLVGMGILENLRVKSSRVLRAYADEGDRSTD